MGFWKTAALVCLMAGVLGGCVTANGSSGALSEEENAELQQGLAEMEVELRGLGKELRQELEAASIEVQLELEAAKAEVYLELDDAKGELLGEFTDPAAVRKLILGGDMGAKARPRRLVWQKGMAEAEVADREAFVDGLALESWQYSEESVDGLAERAAYTVEVKKYAGILDRWNQEYVSVARLAAYDGSNLVSLELDLAAYPAGGLVETAAEMLGEIGPEEWRLVIVYEVPEEDAEALRSLSAAAG